MRSRNAWCLLVLVSAVVVRAADGPESAAGSGAPLALAAAAADGILSLDEAKRVALADNPGIAAALARVDLATAVVHESLAAYFPTISLAASARHTEATPTDFGGGPDADTSRLYGLSTQASWLVFDGFARRFRVASARAAADASKAAAREVQRLLLQGVALSYYEALLAREAMTIAARDREFNRDLSSETRKRFDAGVAARSDVLNFDIRVARADSSYLSAGNDFDTARVALAQLLGLPAAALPAGVVPAPLTEAVPNTLPDLHEELAFALAHRPDYQALQDRRRGLQAELRVARAGYLPQVAVAADYGWTRESNPRFNDDRDAASAVGLSATWELFAGGATRARVTAVLAQERAIGHELTGLTHSIAAELRQRIDALRVAQQQAALQERIRDMTLETRDLVRSEYLAGRGSLTRLNEAQTDLVRAEGQLVLAQIRYWQVSELLAGASAKILDQAVQPALVP